MLNKWNFIKKENKYILQNNNINYTGSGFLIFQENGTNPIIILVITKNGDNFICEDMGGSIGRYFIANNNTLFLNAKKKVYEETQCLFSFYNINKQIYLDIPINESYYRCFFVIINNSDILKEKYDTNKKILQNLIPELCEEWQETYGLEKFYFKDLLKAYVNKQDFCKNIDGKIYKIRDRVFNCIKSIIHNRDIIKTMINNIPKYNKKIVNDKDSLFNNIMKYEFE